MQSMMVNETTTTVTPRAQRIKPDPFKLRACQKYGKGQGPFEIKLSVEALCLVDCHAHFEKNEVIGLLGGLFSPDRRHLTIFTAIPCDSLSSSDRDCEVDPVSLYEATEKIYKMGHKVVGWYHSHPTFVDNPSQRDLETQIELQEYFSKDQPSIVGMILSPYYALWSRSAKNSFVSRYKCLIVQKMVSASGIVTLIPYELESTVIRREKLAKNVVDQVGCLARKIRHSKTLLMLDDMTKGHTINRKLHRSLKHYLEVAGLADKESEYILEAIFEVASNYLIKSAPHVNGTAT